MERGAEEPATNIGRDRNVLWRMAELVKNRVVVGKRGIHDAAADAVLGLHVFCNPIARLTGPF